uniref:Cytoplasmic tRNA 2-thiolation protein 2 n=1 Tax=Graphocephala atropunctata TaxID=36148 RepID=A0A1B6KH68_9HEMI
MCSNHDVDNDGLMLMEKVDKPNLTGQWCRKCVDKIEAKVVLRKKDAYCKQCFLSSVSHKFRACLGKSKTMRPGDKVLVGFSGTDNSVALLHLIQTGVQEISHKRLMFEPCVAYIDEGTALQLRSEESNRISESVDGILQTFSYPVYKVPLELAIESEEVVENFINGGSNLIETSNLCALFESISDITSKMDLLCKLRYNLLIQVAKALGCNKMFTAETADDLAVRLMTNVSLGRGSQLPYDVGFSDERCPEVKVVRPLRDLSKKELTFYNVFHRLKSAHIPSLSTMADTHSSIQKLTESFLCELQDGFPSTLSTVFRVADKLTTTSGERSVCPLCKTPLDADDVASSSLRATQFSRLVSSSGPSKLAEETSTQDSSSNSETRCCGDNSSTSNSCSKRNITNELQMMLCYSCKLILKNADIDKLPAPVIQKLRESNQRFRMKKEIEQFLL